MFGQFLQLIILAIASIKAFSISYRPLARIFFQSTLASLAGAISSYVTLAFVVDGINQETFIGIMIQGVAAGIMGLLAIVLVYGATGSNELKEIFKSFQTKIFSTDVIAPQ